MLKIKDLKNRQRFYAMDADGEPYSFRVWMEPTKVNDIWTVDCTDEGDYCFTFTEEDEKILFLTDSLGH